MCRHRKKRFKKRKIHHPPEYYEELKLNKINQVRETHWNNRFAYDAIPEALETKKAKTGQKGKNNAFRFKCFN